MSRRIRWYRVSELGRRELDEVVKGLSRDEYSSRKKWGFSNVTLHGDSLRGQYIEKYEAVTRVQDPFGKVLEFPHVEYEHFIFHIGIRYPQLELHDPGRNLGAFFNQVAQYLNFKMAIEAPPVDVLRWADLITERADSAQVHGAWVTNVSLSNTVAAKIALTGTEDVRPFIKKIVGKRSYSFLRVQIAGIFHSQPFKCELFPDSKANILNGVETEIAGVLRETLAQMT
jgi:hypothetical protein